MATMTVVAASQHRLCDALCRFVITVTSNAQTMHRPPIAWRHALYGFRVGIRIETRLGKSAVAHHTPIGAFTQIKITFARQKRPYRSGDGMAFTTGYGATAGLGCLRILVTARA